MLRVRKIKLATEADIPQCLEVRAAAFANQAPQSYTGTEVMRLIERDETPRLIELTRAGQLFVAASHTGVVGLGGWMDHNLYNLYVHPSYMRKGIGSLLLAHIEEQFIAKSQYDELLVDAGLYTRSFYESQGYMVVGVATASDGLRYLEMEKRMRRGSSLKPSPQAVGVSQKLAD